MKSMDYESMYKQFRLTTDDISQLDALTRQAMAGYSEHTIVTTLIHGDNGTQIINKEVVDAELV